MIYLAYGMGLEITVRMWSGLLWFGGRRRGSLKERRGNCLTRLGFLQSESYFNVNNYFMVRGYVSEANLDCQKD